MNETLKWTLISIGIVLAVVAVIVGICFLHSWILRKQNRYSQAKTGSFLKKFASIRSYKVISDYKLRYGNEIVTADQILIGFFGMIVLKTCNQKGVIYGEARSDKWSAVVTDKKLNDTKTTFDNPVREIQKCNEAMRKLLIDNDRYKIPTECYVVFGEKKAELANMKKKNSMNILTMKQLKKLLQKEKYSADGPVDVKEVCDFLMAHQAK